MKIWVPGAEGMLGQAVCEALAASGDDVIATGHEACPIDDDNVVVETLDRDHPQAVINCAGKGPGSYSYDMLMSNAVGPVMLAEICHKRGLRLVLVSTDCVFSGTPSDEANRRYAPADIPDPKDAYGISKRAGEVISPDVLLVRTSFVGTASGLGHWLLQQKGRIDGWVNAFWTGTSVHALAQVLAQEVRGIRIGLHHAASAEKVSKAWLLREMADILGLNVDVQNVPDPHIDRALAPTIDLPPLRTALEMLKDGR